MSSSHMHLTWTCCSESSRGMHQINLRPTSINSLKYIIIQGELKCIRLCCVAATDGCPDLCSGHGRCQLQNSVWQCVCGRGWKASHCNLAMEVECESNRDEDEGELQSLIVDINEKCVLLL